MLQLGRACVYVTCSHIYLVNKTSTLINFNKTLNIYPLCSHSFAEFDSCQQSNHVLYSWKVNVLSSTSRTDKIVSSSFSQGKNVQETFSDESRGRRFAAEYLQVCLCGRWRARVTLAWSRKSHWGRIFTPVRRRHYTVCLRIGATSNYGTFPHFILSEDDLDPVTSEQIQILDKDFIWGERGSVTACTCTWKRGGVSAHRHFTPKIHVNINFSRWIWPQVANINETSLSHMVHV